MNKVINFHFHNGSYRENCTIKVFNHLYDIFCEDHFFATFYTLNDRKDDLLIPANINVLEQNIFMIAFRAKNNLFIKKESIPIEDVLKLIHQGFAAKNLDDDLLVNIAKRLILINKSRLAF